MEKISGWGVVMSGINETYAPPTLIVPKNLMRFLRITQQDEPLVNISKDDVEAMLRHKGSILWDIAAQMGIMPRSMLSPMP